MGKTAKNVESEFILTISQNALTRFTQNYIHQNMASEESNIQLRVIINGREGTFTTNCFDDTEMLRNAAEKAVEIARAQKPDKTFPGLPKGVRQINFSNASPSTEKCSPARRAAIVKKIISQAKKHKAEAAGALSTRTERLIIWNSNNVRACQYSTKAELNLVVSRGHYSGYSYWAGSDIEQMPFEQMAMEAIQKTGFVGEPYPIAPGAYTVVLSPYAVAVLAKFLSYMGFSAKDYIEKRSFMNNLMGKKAAGRNVTIFDDGMNLEGIPRAFDYEGSPKKKVYFIKNGVAVGLVHDSRTAAKMGVPNTGHALPMPNSHGPFALNLFVAPGKSSEKEIIQNTRHGIYVTKIHYPNIVEPIATIMTGMTKDGTFLIENGRITKPIRNLRFTQSVLEAFCNVEDISRERRCLASNMGACTAPAMRIKDFHFTGVSNLADGVD
ncbi:MAG TPA: TldD/PmbA family protein [Candidatus Sumerlaeia bacterium]|nr:MAG: protease TldD [candidate division BRC1 bacterium ADurb.Bin183]HRR99749.1 TldD/PmbA family protein [Candidatus Sumerlaeia bacterium]